MTEQQHDERRASRRAPFSGITLVHTPSREIHCIAGNLSASGILLYPQRPQSRQTHDAVSSRSAPPGARGPSCGLEAPNQMRVTFALPTTARWIELSGTVVREQRDLPRPAWGVRFDGVPDEVGHLLERYVSSVARHRRARVVTPPPIVPPAAPTPDRALPPPLPDDLDDEASTVRGSLFEETTNRLPADEAALLAATLVPGEEPPTRRTPAAEIAPLKDRCRKKA